MKIKSNLFLSSFSPQYLKGLIQSGIYETNHGTRFVVFDNIFNAKGSVSVYPITKPFTTLYTVDASFVESCKLVFPLDPFTMEKYKKLILDYRISHVDFLDFYLPLCISETRRISRVYYDSKR